jgi:hypothetical protein
MPHPGLSFAASVIGATAAAWLLSNATAGAETKSFRDFLAACDNARQCVVYGLPTAAYGAYLKIERGAAPNATPKATLTVEFLAANAFTLAFDDPVLHAVLPSGPFVRASKDEESKHIVIDKPDAVAAMLDAVRKAKSLRVTRQDPPGVEPSDPVETEISMNGAAAALLWVDEQQKRLDTQTAFVRRGGKPASAVPTAPALPVIAAPKINTASLAAQAPTALDPKSSAEVRKLCGDTEDDAEFSEASRLNGKLVLYAYVCRSMSGAYNQAYKFLVAPEDAPQHARAPTFIAPSELKSEDNNDVAMNASFDAKTATLTTFAKGRGPGDCGIETGWTWDGKAFRVSRYRSMPTCRGVPPDDWPTVYWATTK